MIVEVSCAMILEKFPEIFHNELWSPGVTILPETLINPQNIDQLVCKIVFGSVAAL